MSPFRALSLVFLFSLSSSAWADSVTYRGTLNGKPVSLQIDLTTQASLESNFIPCQTMDDQPCAGPGIYAYFFHAGSVTLTAEGRTEKAPLRLALYIGAEKTREGILEGNFSFTDRTDLPANVDDVNQLLEGTQFSEEQYGAHGIVLSVSRNQVVASSFPASYTLSWTRENSSNPLGFDHGSIELAR